jgi:hypothetical protein
LFPEGQIATLVYGVVKVAKIDAKGVLTSLRPIWLYETEHITDATVCQALIAEYHGLSVAEARTK